MITHGESLNFLILYWRWHLVLYRSLRSTVLDLYINLLMFGFIARLITYSPVYFLSSKKKGASEISINIILSIF